MESLISAFRFIFNHVETTVGVSIGLIIVTGILLLLRMVYEKPASSVGGGGAQLDVQALETTLKRVMVQAQAVGGGAGVAGESAPNAEGAAAPSAAQIQAAVAEREKTIGELQKALATAKAEATKSAAAPAEGGGDAAALGEMQNKVRDLEARLAEYSIIEDDIADLSMYKDENARLKAEVEALKMGGGAGAGAAAAAASAEPDPVDEFASAVSAQTAPEIEPETKVEPVTATAVEPAAETVLAQDAIDAMFAEPTPEAVAATEAPAVVAPEPAAAAPAPEPAPAAAAAEPAATEDPLAGALDTNKMLEEVSKLDSTTESSEDVLGAALDTDKLLSEVNELKAGSGGAPSEPTANDDLFGEFKGEEES